MNAGEATVTPAPAVTFEDVRAVLSARFGAPSREDPATENSFAVAVWRVGGYYLRAFGPWVGVNVVEVFLSDGGRNLSWWVLAWPQRVPTTDPITPLSELVAKVEAASAASRGTGAP